MRIFGRPLQTAMSYLCALCQPLPLSFIDADDDYDEPKNCYLVVMLFTVILQFCCVLNR